MSKVCLEAITLLREFISYNNLLDSTLFSVSCFSKFRASFSKILNDFGLNGFTLVQKGTNRPQDDEI